MNGSIRKTITAIAALAALALGGSALADAASNSGSSSSQQQAVPPQPGGQPPQGPPPGLHVGANGQREQALTGDTAAKVKAAAEAKVPGTVERVETDVDFGSPYEAHVRKFGGSEVSVLVNKSFQVTAVKAMPQHP
ncbi:MAG: hypothetical protein QOD53_2288 [Thermoleophilaceae bacterium]|nr:hypothetical protein [Thermoleophilaceae bacterium]